MREGAGTAFGADVGLGVAVVGVAGAGVTGVPGTDVAKMPPAWDVSEVELKPMLARLPLYAVVGAGVLMPVNGVPIVPPPLAPAQQACVLRLAWAAESICTHTTSDPKIKDLRQPSPCSTLSSACFTQGLANRHLPGGHSTCKVLYAVRQHRQMHPWPSSSA